MKKIIFSLAAIATAAMMFAGANYVKQEDGTYTYVGDSVTSFSVDFTKWATTDLPDKIYDADEATEAGNMAFVKWMITERSVQMTSGATAVKKKVAFNSGTTNDATAVKNNKTSNKPRIYLPTTARGVKKITAHMAIASTSGRSVAVYYKDEKHAKWTYVSGQTLDIKTAANWDVAEASLELNTTGKTSIYLQYGSNEYFGILDVALDIMGEDTTITLDKQELSLIIGDSATLSATVNPSTVAYQWKSDNESVATVVDGKINTVAIGTANIIAYAGNAADTCVLTVKDYPVVGDYAMHADGLYHYTGVATDGLAIEFSDLQSTDVAYTTGTTHADRLITFQDLGLYKWSYLASRQCGTGATYAPVLWNNGTSENGKNGEIRDTKPTKMPAIYFPEIENGIKDIVVEGWTNGSNSRTLMFKTETTDGSWVPLDSITKQASSYYVTMKGSVFTSDTIHVNSYKVKKVMFWRNSNDYQFLTKVAITQMEGEDPSTGYKEVTDEIKAKKMLKNGKLYIRRNGEEYDVLGR